MRTDGVIAIKARVTVGQLVSDSAYSDFALSSNGLDIVVESVDRGAAIIIAEDRQFRITLTLPRKLVADLAREFEVRSK